MANEFLNTQNGAALLKANYGDKIDAGRDPLTDALRARRRRLKNTLIGEPIGDGLNNETEVMADNSMERIRR